MVNDNFWHWLTLRGRSRPLLRDWLPRWLRRRFRTWQWLSLRGRCLRGHSGKAMLAQCLGFFLELLNIAFDLLLPLLRTGHLND